MVRRLRIHFPGALYRVIVRGNPKQDILLAEWISGANRLYSMTRDRIKKRVPLRSNDLKKDKEWIYPP